MKKLKEMKTNLENKKLELDKLEKEYRREFMKQAKEDILKLKIMKDIETVMLNDNNELILISKETTTHHDGPLKRSTVDRPVINFADRRDLKVDSYLGDKHKLTIKLYLPYDII